MHIAELLMTPDMCSSEDSHGNIRIAKCHPERVAFLCVFEALNEKESAIRTASAMRL